MHPVLLVSFSCTHLPSPHDCCARLGEPQKAEKDVSAMPRDAEARLQLLAQHADQPVVAKPEEGVQVLSQLCQGSRCQRSLHTL